MMNSRIPGFHKLSRKERQEKIGLANSTSVEDGLTLEQAEGMVENVIGFMKLPMGVATNFLINDKDYLVPMATEEPSVVAAASNAAKLARVKKGFRAKASEPIMVGQIQLLDVDTSEAEEKILGLKKDLIELANQQDKVLVKFGGGAVDLKTKKIEGSKEMLVVYLHVDVRDAMGANAVNTMCEAVAKKIVDEVGGRVCLRIISNYATERTVKSEAVFDKDALGGEKVVDGILDAYDLAVNDVYRAVTHNKGIMNGIDAVVVATGNDFRAVESGAHAYAARKGTYGPLTEYSKDNEGNLVSKIELPLAVGIIGGATKTNPGAKAALKILGVKTAQELSEVIASVGLAQNLAALKALATEGIQKGHMRLHAKNIAVTAGAKGEQIEKVAEQIVKDGEITVEHAEKIVGEI